METAQSITAHPGAMDTRRPHPDVTKSAGPGGKRWLVVLAMVSGLFMPMLDHLMVNVALPTIQHQLGASFAFVRSHLTHPIGGGTDES